MIKQVSKIKRQTLVPEKCQISEMQSAKSEKNPSQKKKEYETN